MLNKNNSSNNAPDMWCVDCHIPVKGVKYIEFFTSYNQAFQQWDAWSGLNLSPWIRKVEFVWDKYLGWWMCDPFRTMWDNKQ